MTSALLITLISEVGGGTDMQSKQAHVLQYKAQSKTKAVPESPLPTLDLNAFAQGFCPAKTRIGVD